jgi:hypothetical protein
MFDQPQATLYAFLSLPVVSKSVIFGRRFTGLNAFRPCSPTSPPPPENFSGVRVSAYVQSNEIAAFESLTRNTSAAAWAWFVS